MDCREWEDKLDALLAGKLSAAEREGFEAHAAGCPRCEELYAAASAGLTGLAGQADLAGAGPQPPADLAAAVLALTSGSACWRARDLIATRAGETTGEPATGAVAAQPAARDAEDAELLAAHVEHCARCRAIESTLRWLVPELRAMAEVEPDADFAYDVLRATSAMRLKRRGTAGWRARVAQRTAGWWRRQVARPHFAAEMAYAGTLVMVVLFGTPVSPFRQVTPKALEVVQATPVGITAAARDVFGLVPGRAGDLGREAWGRTGGRLTGSVDGAAGGLRERGRRASAIGGELSRHAGELGRALLRHDFVQAAGSWSDVRSDLKRLWTTWLGKAPETTAPVEPMTTEARRQS